MEDPNSKKTRIAKVIGGIIIAIVVIGFGILSIVALQMREDNEEWMREKMQDPAFNEWINKQ